MPAATVLEVDFQNFNSSNNTVTASAAKSGTQNVLTLNGTVSQDLAVNPTGNNGLSVPANPDVTTGYFYNNRVTGNLASSLSTTGSTGEFRDYFGANLGTGTIAFVYQPDNSANASRAYLFGTDVSGTSNWAVQLMINPDRSVQFNVGTGASTTWKESAISSTISWDATKWYYLAASWTGDAKLTLYVREVGASEGILYTSAEILEQQTQSNGKNLILGNSQATAGENPSNGSLAYFWAGDTYTETGAGYDALYATAIPEPGTVALLLGSAGLAGLYYRSRKARI